MPGSTPASQQAIWLPSSWISIRPALKASSAWTFGGGSDWQAQAAGRPRRALRRQARLAQFGLDLGDGGLGQR